MSRTARVPTLGGGISVADQVATLPPLAQLLGLDGDSQASEDDRHVRGGRRSAKPPVRSTRAGHGGRVKGPADASVQETRRTPATLQEAAALLEHAAAPGTGPFRDDNMQTSLSSGQPVALLSLAVPQRQAPPQPPSAPRCAGGLLEWRRVQQSLQLPVAYRDEGDVRLTLRLLRSLPLFTPLLENDLLTLAETMAIVDANGAGTVLLRKPVADDTAVPLTAVADGPSRGTSVSVTGEAASAATTGASASTSTSAAGKSPTPLPPPLSPGATSTPARFFDDDDADDAQAHVWTMPAAHLFKCFREQMQRGERPTLPPGCQERRTVGGAADAFDGQPLPSTGPNKTQPHRRSGARPRSQHQHRASIAAAAAAARRHAAGSASTPMVSVADDIMGGEDGTGPNAAFAMVLLSGHCDLEWPLGPLDTLNGSAEAEPRWQSYRLQPGDAMGYALLWGALPPGAQYVTSESCMLLVINGEDRSVEIADRLRRVCRRANEGVLRVQRRFLAQELRVRLFDPVEAPPPRPPSPRAATAEPTARAAKERLSTSQASHGPLSLPTVQPAAPATSAAASAITKASADGPPPFDGDDGSDGSGVPAVSALLEKAARQLIPVRLPTQGVVFREGLTPRDECALFFLVEGGLTVSRRIWSQDQQRLLAEKTQLVRVLTPATGISPLMAPLPSTESMEVTRLRPGDYCGDLAFLGEDPDHVVSIDAEWTDAYWNSTLAQANTERSKSEQRHRGPAAGAAGAAAAADVASEAAPSASDAEEVNNFMFRRHKASVVAQQASAMYVLLPPVADEVVRGPVRERMCAHIREDYVGYRQVFAEYEKLYKWALYKERVLCDVSKKTPSSFR